jgi:hypothetical protein
MSGGIFSTRTSRILVVVCGVSLIAGLLMAIFQDKIETTNSSGTDSFSRSALGHRAFRLLLEEAGFPVIASRNGSADKAGYRGLLVVAEPDLNAASGQRWDIFRHMPLKAFTMLVVLPKRQGYLDPLKPSWLESVEPVPEKKHDLILEAMGLDGEIVRGEDPSTLEWIEGGLDFTPNIDEMQLLDGDELEPIIANENGALLSYYYATDEDNPFSYVDIYILSDPDLLANHGLGRDKNAAFALRIMETITENSGLVVFDETLHGHHSSQSSMATFFRFPLVFLTLQILVMTLVLVWMAGGRFGSPLPPAVRRDQGHNFLIDNTADLLQYSGHAPFILKRYFQAAVIRICRRLHVEMPGSRAAAHARFVNICDHRCPDFDFDRMDTEVTVLEKMKNTRPAEVLESAEAIYRWQQEMTNGL